MHSALRNLHTFDERFYLTELNGFWNETNLEAFYYQKSKYFGN